MASRGDVVAWRGRWVEVNRATDEEARTATAAERLRSVSRLRAFVTATGSKPWADDEATIWARFQRLRSAYHDRLPIR